MPWLVVDPIFAYAMIALSLAAAITDWRTGHIPNWLTLPPLVIAPLAHAFTGDVTNGLWSLAGALVCSIMPLVLWRMRAPQLESAPASSTHETLSDVATNPETTGASDPSSEEDNEEPSAAMGGGDVKLFAALGALGLPHLGMEAQFLSVFAAGGFAIVLLAWKGHLWRTLTNTVFLVINPALPKHKRRVLSHEAMTAMRLGPYIFCGVTLAVALRRPWAMVAL